MPKSTGELTESSMTTLKKDGTPLNSEYEYSVCKKQNGIYS